MFLPVSISIGSGGEQHAGYNRILETSEKFDALGKRSTDMTEPLTAIGEDLHTQIAAAFGSQGATGLTGTWAQLSDNPEGHGYRSLKQRHVPGVPILVGIRHVDKGTRDAPNRGGTWKASGKMMRQMLIPVGKASGGTWHITQRRLLFTPLSDYAGYLETGTENMPARPPVDVGPTFLHSVDRTFLTWFTRLMNEAGLAGPGSG